jgi:hypothetical protein
MTGEPGTDYPEIGSEVHIWLEDREVATRSWVVARDGDVLVLHPSVSDVPSVSNDVEQPRVTVGDGVEVFWQRPEDQRAAPAEVEAVEEGPPVRWRLRRTGPAEVTQRRRAVRGRIVAPVELDVDGVTVRGETSDISEYGARVTAEGAGPLPETGMAVGLRIELDSGVLAARVEVIRMDVRGVHWLLSLRFLDLDEKEQDRVRRRVFQALREERARNNQ